MALDTTIGGASADAFVTVAGCEAYCANRGLTEWTSQPDSPADAKEAAIRRATDYLSRSYTWKGYKAAGRLQALAWPRSDVTDGEGQAVGSDVIPVEVINACCEIAARELTTPGYASPDVVLTDRVKRETIGPITTEYASTTMSAQAARPVMLKVDDMVSGLVSGSSNMLAGSARRA